MRTINSIILHCTASNLQIHDNVSSIRYWHKMRGWDDIGYQYVITKQDIEPQIGRPIHIAGAHCLGQNKDSVGIVFCGLDNFINQQFDTGADLCWDIMLQFGLGVKDIYPHNHFNKNKTCPNFDVEHEIIRRVNEHIKRHHNLRQINT